MFDIESKKPNNITIKTNTKTINFDLDNSEIDADLKVGKIHGAYTCLAEGTYTAADSSVVFSQEKLCKFKFFFSHSAPPGHSAEGVFQIILSSYDLRKN